MKYGFKREHKVSSWDSWHTKAAGELYAAVGHSFLSDNPAIHKIFFV